jgi:hypothetical protein
MGLAILTTMALQSLAHVEVGTERFSITTGDAPVRTRHFKPDPETKEGRDALLSRQAVIKHIEENCKMPKLQDLTVVGVPESMGLLLLRLICSCRPSSS